MAVRKTKKGASLKRWFKEKWVDVRTGKPCGRTKGDGRGVPYCRPSKRISSKTPKTTSEMYSSEKKKKITEKKIIKEKNKMDFSDIKLLIINGAALLVSFSDIEIILKICLLMVSIGYTITKWKDIYKNEKNK